MAKAKSTASKPFTDKQVKELTSFEAAITDETAEALEKVAGGNEIGIQRRMCLAVVSRDAPTLAKLRTEAPEAFRKTFEAVEGFVKHIQGVQEVAQAAHWRMKIADCMGASDDEPFVPVGGGNHG